MAAETIPHVRHTLTVPADRSRAFALFTERMVTGGHRSTRSARHRRSASRSNPASAAQCARSAPIEASVRPVAFSPGNHLVEW